MNGDVREYARLGLVHHMLYADALEDPDRHAETLEALVRRTDIETFDCCVPYEEKARQRAISAVRGCGKSDIAFAMHLFPLRKISLCSTSVSEQGQTRLIVKDMVECAAAAGVSKFIFATGGPAPAEATDAHRAAVGRFCRWFCGELRRYGITALLEPFDVDIDKKFLYGSTKDCVALIDSLRPETDNMGIELDIAHLPLMREEFDDAIKTAAPCLKRVHLGNCVLKDSSHPLYGDTHPPIGLEGGEIDIAETTIVLRSLLETGFLDAHDRGSLLIEMNPFPDKGVDETVEDNFRRVEQAWNRV